MTTLNPYLIFTGNCEDAFNFYKSVFRGDFQFIGRYKDIPQPDRQNFPSENDEKIMHVTLRINEATILQGCDSGEAPGQPTIFGNNLFLSLNVESQNEADRLFNELSAGGLVRMSMNQTFWGAYFGSLTDRFGIHWNISAG